VSKYIVVGIDYGTRFTKVLFRDNDQVQGQAYVVVSQAFRDGLFPSLLSLEGEVIKPYQTQGEVIAYLKMVAAYAVTAYEKEPSRALEAADIRIPDGLKKLRGTYQDLDLVGLCLSYYFGCLLAEAHRCIEEKLNPGKGDKVLYQLAVPTALTMQNKEMDKFFWVCLVNGRELFKRHRTRILEGLSLSEIYESIERDVLSKYEEIKARYKHRCATYPETAAAVAGFFFSKNSSDGIFITADVGAGTVDLNIFRRNRLNDQNQEPTLAYYSTQVAPLGAQMVSDEFKYVNPLAVDLLKEKLYKEIRKLIVQARRKQPNHGEVGDLRRTYDGARIFLFGGGKRNPVYRETLLEGLDSQLEKNFDYGGVNNPVVLDLPDYREIERPSPHVDSGRYAVAFGLTNNPLNLHKIILPDELSDITREPPPEDQRYGFDWND
jgi:hypothetical protein